MKKVISTITVFFLLVGMFFVPDMTVWAAGLGVSVSASTVNIGDSVTATVSVPSGYGATISVSYDSSVLELTSSSGNGALLNLGDAMGQPVSGTIIFKAIGAGSCTISASSTVAGDANGEPVNLDGAAAAVTVANAVTPPPIDNPNNNTGDTGNNGGGTGNEPSNEPALSADNSLASLVLSAGELSPEFYYSTTNYTAVVDYNVTNIAITAKTSNAKAQIISVTGNENLVVGENTIKIVVKAENGVMANYIIKVTRKSMEESGITGDGGNAENNQPDNQLTNEFVVNGETVTPAEIIPDDAIPADFSKDTIDLAGIEYPCLQYNNGAVTLLYFADEDAGNGALYVYDKDSQMVYPYIRLNSEHGYILILVPAMEMIDTDWQEISLTFEGKGIADVFHDSKQPENYYYLYAMNQNGELSWYEYDHVDGTYMRYYPREVEENASEEQDNTAEYEILQDSYQKLTEELENTKKKSYIYMGILVVIIAIMFIGIVIFFVTSERGAIDKDDTDEDDMDNEDDTDEDDDADEDDTDEDGAEEDDADEDVVFLDESVEPVPAVLPDVSEVIFADETEVKEIMTEKATNTPDDENSEEEAMEEAVSEDNSSDEDLEFIDL